MGHNSELLNISDSTNNENIKVVCNACGLYFKMHKRMRPVSMRKGIRKRNRRKDKMDYSSIGSGHFSNNSHMSAYEQYKNVDVVNHNINHNFIHHMQTPMQNHNMNLAQYAHHIQNHGRKDYIPVIEERHHDFYEKIGPPEFEENINPYT